MKKRQNPSSFISWLALLLLFGCINQIEVFRRADRTLVVDGVITNEPGPQRVKILFTRTYNTGADYDTIKDAIVKVIDNLGNEELFTYDQYGYFQSSENFSGVVGRAYKINITLESGRQYESVPDTLLPIAPVDELYYQERGDFLDFFVNFQDDPNRKNYYRWRFRNTIQHIAPITKARCWVSDFDNEFLNIDSDQLFNGKNIRNLWAFSVKLDKNFNYGYYALVRQMSLTRPAFEFWRAVKNQLNNNGTIFETANFQILGNVHSLTDSDEIVLGYFGASAVESRSVLILEYMGRFQEVCCAYSCYSEGIFSQRCYGCSGMLGLPTYEKPDFWP